MIHLSDWNGAVDLKKGRAQFIRMDWMTIFVALLGPSGIWFGWFLQGRHRKADIIDRNRVLLRQKAEEALAEVQKAQDRGRTAVVEAIADKFGQLPANHENTWAGDLTQLSVLIEVYFPSIRHLIVEHQEQTYPLVAEHQRALAALPAVGCTADDLQTCRELTLKHQREMNDVTIRSLAKIRVAIIAQVRPLIAIT